MMTASDLRESTAMSVPVCHKPLRGTDRPATGTDAGAQRHYRAGERPCAECAAAHSVHSTRIQTANRPAHRAANARWRAANPGYFGKRQRDRLTVDDEFRMIRILRKRVWDAVNGSITEASALSLLGCTVAALRVHLEERFLDGMTWGNYGRDGWEVDHIRPLASFDLSDPAQLAECFHFTNLQPLWANDNRVKGRTYLVEEAKDG